MKKRHCAPLGPGEHLDFTAPATWGSRELARKVDALAGSSGRRLGLTRREFLKSQVGMAASLLAVNSVFGTFFRVDPAEARDPEAAAESARALEGQLVFDVQVHFVHDGYPSPGGLLSLRRAADEWDGGPSREQTPEDLEFENFYQEVFEQSQTRMAVLSNAPADDKSRWFLTNAQCLGAREKVNRRVGRQALLAHGLFTPGHPGWMEDLEQTAALLPDAWKGYTIGSPGADSRHVWRLDDEKLVYPAYERMAKAGVRTVCIHKGLLPTGYQGRLSREQIAAAGVEDVGQAARDWPELAFVIYHSAIEKVVPTAEDAERFRRTGRIDWVTDLAEIPGRFGVKNVYAELGAVFGATCVAHPDLCAGVLGTLIRGMGADRVCWGTDSVWLGSPQWQIEAFRRFEIPEAMQKERGFAPLGPADGPVKQAILGLNSSRLYEVVAVA
jgi:predicted TIM-barrel fold metal-dependent hydrolase